jgi:hypothetical protein
MLVVEFRNIYQLEPYYYPEFKKYMFRQDVKFNFNIDMPVDIISAGNIFAKNIDCNSIRAINVYANNIRSKKISSNILKCDTLYSTEFVKASELTSRYTHVYKIDSQIIISSDIIARYIKAKKIIYHTVCIAIDELNCNDVASARKNHISACLNYKGMINYYG